MEGDGLLTIRKVLGLKLDADWMMLSAYNTGSGAGAGAIGSRSAVGRSVFARTTSPMIRRIQESEERYRMHFSEQANDSTPIVDPKTLRFLDVNENAAARHGYTRNVLGSKTSTLPRLSSASWRSSKRCRRKAALSSEAIRG